MMDIKPNDLPLLLSLQTLLATENVTKAADQLGISQPALSAQLARMRDRFKDPILVPSGNGKGMAPTPWAEAIRGPLRDALHALDAVLRTGMPFDPTVSRRRFRILANDHAATLIGPNLAGGLGAGHWPALQLAITAAPTEGRQLAAMLEDGTADIALGSAATMPDWAQQIRLTDNAFFLAQRPHHPRGTAPPTARDYCRLNHVVVSSRGEYDSFVDTELAKLGLRRTVSMAVQYYTLVPLLIEASDMVCTLPTAFLQSFRSRLDIYPLKFLPQKTGLHAAWHPRFEHDPAHGWLRQQIVAACKSGGEQRANVRPRRA